MSRILKWKVEKAKVKVVFRLQFHATHIPQGGWERLFISLVPLDSGKATARTSKASVRNGICKWPDPIYESTRLLQDSKTKRYDEKPYKFVVSMGSSRSGLLGEANINLADYADALKPHMVSLSVNGTNSKTLLHVTVQLLTSKTGFREFEQQREHRERRLLNGEESSHDGGMMLSSQDTSNDEVDKANAKVRFKCESKEQTSQEEETIFNEDYTESSTGFDVSSNTSESIYVEKNESISPHGNGSTKSTISGGLKCHGWGSEDYSMDNESETNKLRGCLEAAESSIIELKLEVISLQRRANEIGVETQKFMEQIAAEVASGEDLAKEVFLLKSECLKCKTGLEDLTNSKVCPQNPTISTRSVDLWLKGIFSLENGLKDFQNKVCFVFHERDLQFPHVEFEVLLSTLHDLKKAVSEEINSYLTIRHSEKEKGDLSETGLHESNATSLFEENISILADLEHSNAEREDLLKKIDQMECYYESLIQELGKNQTQLLGELQSLKNEHSTCHYTILSTKAQLETVHQEMNTHISHFMDDRESLESANKLLERRALTSEASLKRSRFNYSKAVVQMQKDLELLSLQVSSMSETNENLIRQTYAESLGGDVFLPSQDKHCLIVEEEVCDLIMANMQLDVFSNTIQETFFQAKEIFYENLEISNRSEESLSQRLHNVNLQNQNLEAQVESANTENRLLNKKIKELEALVDECMNYESQYKACATEKTELHNLLNRGYLENESLQNKVTSLESGVESFQSELKKLVSEKGNLLEIFNILHNKLVDLLVFCENKTVGGQSSWSKSSSCILDFKELIGVLSQLEKLQHELSDNHFQLMEERNALERESVVAKSENEIMRQRFEHELQGMINKLDLSNALVQDLELQVGDFAKKLNAISEAEEKFTFQNRQLFSEYARVDLELKKVISKNEEYSRKISALGTISNEIEKSKLIIIELMQQNEDLFTSLREKTEESAILVLELHSLKESLEGMKNEFHSDRDISTQNEARLSRELAEKNDQLHKAELRSAEIVNFKELASDLELKKSMALETQLSEIHELLLAADVEVVFTRSQCFIMQNRLGERIVSENSVREENKKLHAILESVNLTTEENRFLSEVNTAAMIEVEEYKNRAAATEVIFLEDKRQHTLEVEQLNHTLASHEEEISTLFVSMVEQESKGLVLESKLNDLHIQMASMEENNRKMAMLENHCNELTHKLAEQVLKAEEFKNLSIHFRELKDKALARENKESDGPSFSMQESLRIAFIREQYETKVQELKHQLSMSKLHGEEMLGKLQDAVDEIENRKKSEASQLKKNGELCLKIVELETELRCALSEKFGKINDFDQLKAEMECLLITLECNKEEKQMLDISLQECKEEKLKIAEELNYIKQGVIIRDMVSGNGSIGNLCEEHECSITKNGEANLDAAVTKQCMQGVNGDPGDNLCHRNPDQIPLTNDYHFKSKNLMSGMEHLLEELEKLKTENRVSSEINDNVSPNFQRIPGELIRLQKVNEELGSIFPSFRELPVNGNALERILALEIEVAEAFQLNDKSNTQFPSLIKEQGWVEWVRDMNEVMKEMLEAKEEKAAVENELNEMHHRYSQLSLQFAEVEGERQKLTMLLKPLKH